MPTIVRRAGTALLGILLICAQGCDLSTDRSIAQAAVATFHSELDAAQYAAMWEDADESLHRNSSREDYDKLIGAVHKKLGTVVNTSTVGWSVNYQNFQTRVSLQQKTQFEHGSGVETFLYIVHGKTAKLAGYHINSNDLITL